MFLVSIIMPTFEREIDVIKRAIESVVKQTYANWQLIIVDDNSNIRFTEEIMRYLGTLKDNRIEYYKNKINMGSALSRNKGIDLSKGEYVTFLDDDDEYLPKKVETQLNAMIQNDADFSITDLNLYNSKNELIRVRKHDYIEKENNLLKSHLMHHLTGTDTFMYKKDYLIKIGKFDAIDSGDEFYLMAKSIEKKGKFYYLPECFVKAYTHDNEKSKGLSTNNQRLLGENKLFEYKKKYFCELNKKEINFIKVRHEMVLSKFFLNQKKYKMFFKHFILAFIISPFCLYNLTKNY